MLHITENDAVLLDESNDVRSLPRWNNVFGATADTIYFNYGDLLALSPSGLDTLAENEVIQRMTVLGSSLLVENKSGVIYAIDGQTGDIESELALDEFPNSLSSDGKFYRTSDGGVMLDGYSGTVFTESLPTGIAGCS